MLLKKTMSPRNKTLILWLLFILGAVAVFHLRGMETASVIQTFSFSELLNRIENKEVREITVKEGVFTGTLNGATDTAAHFRAEGPKEIDTAMLEKIRASGAQVYYKTQEEFYWPQLILSWLPMIILFGFFFFSMRQIQGGGGRAMSFGRSKAKLMEDTNKRATFKDVAGVEEAKEELEEIIAFLKDPKKFTRLGGRIPKGVLLMGSPGTGKTLLARAVAGEAGVPFFSISGSDFVEMFVGVGAARVRDLFEQGKKNAPCIVFIDEIDAVGRHRGAGLGGGHDEREQTLNQLLVEMDGFESNEGVIIMAATNRPDVLDPALLRPGRFDRRVTVPRPDVRGREEILKVHANKTKISGSVDLATIARGTPGFSGADLASVVNEAALNASRFDKESIEMSDFEAAKDKVMMGSERKSMIISEQEKSNTAYHEAGHTLVAKKLPGADPIHKVTIIPRGAALGLTQQLPTDDRYTQNRGYCEDLICILMGGRIAEELVFNQPTTGAGNDIERATELARRMVCEWGMSEKMGPLAFGRKEQQVFLGKELGHQKDYSEETAKQIDSEIHDIVYRNYLRAREIVQANMGILKVMSEALLEYETLDAVQVNQLMEGKKLGPRPKKKVESPKNSTTTATNEDAPKKKTKIPPITEPTKA